MILNGLNGSGEQFNVGLPEEDVGNKGQYYGNQGYSTTNVADD